jgi:hypothetical protein
MSNQQGTDSCGYHGADANGLPLFDYTCDDCMLPWNHKEPPQINDLPDTTETIRSFKKAEKKLKKEFGFPDIQRRGRKLLQDRNKRDDGSKRDDNI